MRRPCWHNSRDGRGIGRGHRASLAAPVLVPTQVSREPAARSGQAPPLHPNRVRTTSANANCLHLQQAPQLLDLRRDVPHADGAVVRGPLRAPLVDERPQARREAVAAVRVAAEDYKKMYGKEDMDLIAAVGIGYPSEKMIGKQGPPRLPLDEVADFRS